MAHDIFISYSTRDKPTADAVCATLESHSIRCWIAPRDVLPGEEYAAALVRALRTSKLMVLVFSSGANESDHVRREVERAASKGIPIIPLRIENVVPTEGMEYYISSRHWLDALNPPLEKHLNQLAETVKVILTGQKWAGPTADLRPVPPERVGSSGFVPDVLRKWALTIPVVAIMLMLLVFFLVARHNSAKLGITHALQEPQSSSSEQLSPETENDFGVKYATGDGVPKDDTQAAAWYRKAAERGYALAQNNLGQMYAHGRGVPQDDMQAVMWYRKAAEQGNVDAQTSLGFMYTNGRGVSKDYVQAVAWFRKAADQGASTAQDNLGVMYEEGLGVAKDEKLAMLLFRKAAEQGNPSAQTHFKALQISTASEPAAVPIVQNSAQSASDSGNLSGIWAVYLQGYSGHFAVRINQNDDRVVGTIIGGDASLTAYIPTGKMMFRGTYNPKSFPAEEICAGLHYSGPYWNPVTFKIIDNDHLQEDLAGAPGCGGFPYLWERQAQ